uniref:Uncharacterized protein n=1 Tax=Mola mola TaxID=94237 RepID=A0A3Q3XI63_MOLML
MMIMQIPPMMADVGGNGKVTNAELEVLKLQELVRKLEKQNEQLRSRANAVNNRAGGPHLQTPARSDTFSCKYGTASPTRSHPCTPEPEEPFAYFQPSSAFPDAPDEEEEEEESAAGAATVLDEVDVLDLNVVVARIVRSRLYASPKAKLQEESVLSPLKWCRRVLDHPGPEVELAKMTFCHRLDQGTVHFPPQSSLDSEVGVSELEDDSISMSYKLQDITDVEVMARLQEESLRQDYASTSATAGRRSSSFSLNSFRRSEMDLEEEDEEDEGYDQLPPPQPRLFRTGSMQRGSLPHSHTFSSMRDCKRTSLVHSKYPNLLIAVFKHLFSSFFTQPNRTTENLEMGCLDKLRRSMPNLIRAPSMPSPSSLPTISSLRSSQSFDSSNGLSRLQSSIPSPGQLSQRVQSVGNFPTTSRHPLKATAYVSPTVQQGPTSTPLSTSVSLQSIPTTSTNQSAVPRSSLPRPASFVGTGGVLRASKMTQPTRSLLTPPKSLAALSALRDGSWKDGCY